MLEYEWGGNPTTMILPTTGDEQQEHHHHENGHPDRHHYFHPWNTNPFNPQEVLMPAGATLYQQQPVNVNPFYDPRAYTMGPTPSFLTAPPPPDQSSSHSGYFLVPKAEEQTQTTTDQFASRIGLNLGGRTYFSSAEDDFVNRLYRRSRPLMMDQAGSSSVARCQAEGCNADLTHAKHYHRRHKVCEFHSKASTVIVHGLTQRFCQQCSRFHLLPEFDNGKRSCRKRLADHNRRRRKSNSQTNGGDNHQDIFGSHCKSPPPPLQHESARNSPSDHLTRSPPDSGVHSPSSVTVALSPPRMPLDCFKQRPYHQASNTATITTSASSSASSSSFFFSSG